MVAVTMEEMSEQYLRTQIAALDRTLFWSKVDQTGECWLWLGSRYEGGYGRLTVRRKNALAHRVAYQMVKGPIPKGAQLDHICHNRDKACTGGRSCIHRRCVNPDHLEPVTNRQNILRGRGHASVNAIKTQCIRGHAY